MATFFSPSNLLAHFQEYVPRLSSRFSNNATVSAVIVDGSPQVLRVTDLLHGLSAGREVVFIEGLIDNDITAVELIADPGGDVLRFTTGKNHDLTLDYQATIELSGFTDSSFNGNFPLVAVPSRNLFEISGSSLPVLNSSEVLREEREIGINGLFTIDRIIDVNIYEIDLTGKPEFTPQTVPILERASKFRMGVVMDVERMKAMYTTQSDQQNLWMFIIMGESGASKNTDIKSDANQTNTSQNPSRVLMINTFSVVVIFPTHKDIGGANASDLSWNEILKLMLATGAGIKFDDFGNTNYLTSLIDHGTGIYNNAYATHVYTFEYNYEITQDEQFLTQFIESVAFRDNAVSFNELEEGSNIDLDEEPT